MANTKMEEHADTSRHVTETETRGTEELHHVKKESTQETSKAKLNLEKECMLTKCVSNGSDKSGASDNEIFQDSLHASDISNIGVPNIDMTDLHKDKTCATTKSVRHVVKPQTVAETRYDKTVDLSKGKYDQCKRVSENVHVSLKAGKGEIFSVKDPNKLSENIASHDQHRSKQNRETCKMTYSESVESEDFLDLQTAKSKTDAIKIKDDGKDKVRKELENVNTNKVHESANGNACVKNMYGLDNFNVLNSPVSLSDKKEKCARDCAPECRSSKLRNDHFNKKVKTIRKTLHMKLIKSKEGNVLLLDITVKKTYASRNIYMRDRQGVFIHIYAIGYKSDNMSMLYSAINLQSIKRILRQHRRKRYNYLKDEWFRLATFSLVPYNYEMGFTMRLAANGFFFDVDGRIKCFHCQRPYISNSLQQTNAFPDHNRPCISLNRNYGRTIADGYGRIHGLISSARSAQLNEYNSVQRVNVRMPEPVLPRLGNTQEVDNDNRPSLENETLQNSNEILHLATYTTEQQQRQTNRNSPSENNHAVCDVIPSETTSQISEESMHQSTDEFLTNTATNFSVTDREANLETKSENAASSSYSLGSDTFLVSQWGTGPKFKSEHTAKKSTLPSTNGSLTNITGCSEKDMAVNERKETPAAISDMLPNNMLSAINCKNNTSSDIKREKTGEANRETVSQNTVTGNNVAHKVGSSEKNTALSAVRKATYRNPSPFNTNVNGHLVTETAGSACNDNAEYMGSRRPIITEESAPIAVELSGNSDTVSLSRRAGFCNVKQDKTGDPFSSSRNTASNRGGSSISIVDQTHSLSLTVVSSSDSNQAATDITGTRVENTTMTETPNKEEVSNYGNGTDSSTQRKCLRERKSQDQTEGATGGTLLTGDTHSSNMSSGMDLIEISKYKRDTTSNPLQKDLSSSRISAATEVAGTSATSTRTVKPQITERRDCEANSQPTVQSLGYGIINSHHRRTSGQSQNRSTSNNIEHTVRYLEYATLGSRIQSFTTWQYSLPVNLLVEAGLFYTGVSDETKCYICGGFLKDWQTDDDPVAEHAKWYPSCPGLGSSQGYSKEQLSEVQDANDSNYMSNESGGISTEDIEDKLTSPNAAELLEEGYRRTDVAEAIRYVLSERGPDETALTEIQTSDLRRVLRELNISRRRPRRESNKQH